MSPTITTPRFSATRYAERIGATIIDRDPDRRIGLDDLPGRLDNVYGADGVFEWRRRTAAEGGYGPMAMPWPDDEIKRGGNRPRPLWDPETFDKWAMQTGRMNLITFRGQKPVRTGPRPGPRIAAPALKRVKRTDGPAPLDIDPGESLSHTRIRALMLAEHHDLIGIYVGPVDADQVEPTRLTYMFLPAGRTLADLKRGELLPTLESDEVLPYLYGLATPAGLAHVFRYRPGLPG